MWPHERGLSLSLIYTLARAHTKIHADRTNIKKINLYFKIVHVDNFNSQVPYKILDNTEKTTQLYSIIDQLVITQSISSKS